jgi:hypothetical protein
LRDADFVVEVEQVAGFGERQQPCGLVAADAEGMRQWVDQRAVRMMVLPVGMPSAVWTWHASPGEDDRGGRSGR